VHLVGGSFGTLCVGLFATKAGPKDADGLFFGGGLGLLGAQALALTVVVLYSLVVTFLIGLFIERLVGNRVRPRQEKIGLDLSQHGEVAYSPSVVEEPSPGLSTAFEQPEEQSAEQSAEQPEESGFRIIR
jgi:Amt family ammonium transporter